MPRAAKAWIPSQNGFDDEKVVRKGAGTLDLETRYIPHGIFIVDHAADRVARVRAVVAFFGRPPLP